MLQLLCYNLYHSSLLDKEEEIIERIYEKHRYVHFDICRNHIAGSKHGRAFKRCGKHKL